MCGGDREGGREVEGVSERRNEYGQKGCNGLLCVYYASKNQATDITKLIM